MYVKNGCEGVIAFGGGSAMDCAKVAAARVVKPNQSVRAMRGQLKVHKKLPPLFAVPTLPVPVLRPRLLLLSRILKPMRRMPSTIPVFVPSMRCLTRN